MSWQQPGRDLARLEAREAVTLASDADRDAAVRVLNEGFADGRLTAGEHAERVHEAYAARTWQELARLTAELPGPAGSPGQAGPGMPHGVDRCLLYMLLILCPPAGIAWLLAARHRPGAGRRQAATAGGGQSVCAAPGGAQTGDGWRAEDR
jgi:hypothetical protein